LHGGLTCNSGLTLNHLDTCCFCMRTSKCASHCTRTTVQCVWPYLNFMVANWRRFDLGEESSLGLRGRLWSSSPCSPWLPYHFSSTLSSICLFSSCGYVIGFIHLGVDVIEPILRFTFSLLIYVYCSLLRILFYALMFVLAWSPFAWCCDLNCQWEMPWSGWSLISLAIQL